VDSAEKVKSILLIAKHKLMFQDTETKFLKLSYSSMSWWENWLECNLNAFQRRKKIKLRFKYCSSEPQLEEFVSISSTMNPAPQREPFE
jgi:hypothetical protein